MSSRLSPCVAIRIVAISRIMVPPMRRTSFERVTRSRPPGYSKPIAARCSEGKSVRWGVGTVRHPGPAGGQGEGSGAGGEDRVRHRALEPVVQKIGRRTDLDGDD